MNNSLQLTDQFLMYTTESDEVRIEVYLADETIWLTQKKMAELFETTPQNITLHLKNIYEEGELTESATCKEYLQVQTEGDREVSRQQKFYNLDAIIAVGYRVNSHRATQFRIWATNTLKEFIIKGFVLDDERLKQARSTFGIDYFKELLERIRSIRASEQRIYKQITDIFAECSIDYDKHSPITKEFYSMVQNKFHYAITGQTAAEIIHTKADSSQPHMGLKTWKHSPAGRILQSDVVIAKNYLTEPEIKSLERTVSSFFDYIEGIIERRQTFTMEQFAASVDKFLSFNEYKIIDGKGSISHAQAKNKAIAEYVEFNKTQRIESDFDKTVQKLLKKERDGQS